ncbi:DUF4189 domain-containing protein [Xanthomonas translucens pv. poae]|uniref:DUF4189 domain-containing protein n=1 Tax=Xanthomonas graminis TaxID=3390026 RepID=UPI0009BA1774|nr:DUF4189 domain-containing protein [Xanthomonas translucens]UKE60833.1 DUF4189 domain-containing protein [Xanthomonas translucens pv. poae]
MKKSIYLYCSLISLGFSTANISYSQTRCPVGAQTGSSQCLPDDEGSAPPRPTGEWLKTWGALVRADDTTQVWASTGMLSEEKAEMDAADQCESAGFKGCKVYFTYENQCVAVASPLGAASGPDLSIAEKDAISVCKRKSGASCSVIYRDCTKPIFKKY